MLAHRLTPILNVSNIQESFAWFEKLGWRKGWDWGEPPTFGGVCSGECEIFLCEGGQGGRGKGANTSTFDSGPAQTADKGVWMSVWVESADDVHAHCIANGIEITWRRRTCRGAYAKRTFDIPMATSSGSASPSSALKPPPPACPPPASAGTASAHLRSIPNAPPRPRPSP